MNRRNRRHSGRGSHGGRKGHGGGGRKGHGGGKGHGKPGKHWVPGSKGVPSDTVKPFFTAQDIRDRLEAEQQYQDTLRQQDSALSDQATQTGYDKSLIDRQEKYDLRDSTDSAAGRGLFMSSIRDADLYDIDATAAIRKNYLDRQLDTATLRAQTTKLAAQNAWDKFQAYLKQKAVENAQTASEDQGPWKTPPTKGHWEPGKGGNGQGGNGQGGNGQGGNGQGGNGQGGNGQGGNGQGGNGQGGNGQGGNGNRRHGGRGRGGGGGHGRNSPLVNPQTPSVKPPAV